MSTPWEGKVHEPPVDEELFCACSAAKWAILPPLGIWHVLAPLQGSQHCSAQRTNFCKYDDKHNNTQKCQIKQEMFFKGAYSTQSLWMNKWHLPPLFLCSGAFTKLRGRKTPVPESLPDAAPRKTTRTPDPAFKSVWRFLHIFLQSTCDPGEKLLRVLWPLALNNWWCRWCCGNWDPPWFAIVCIATHCDAQFFCDWFK